MSLNDTRPPDTPSALCFWGGWGGKSRFPLPSCFCSCLRIFSPLFCTLDIAGECRALPPCTTLSPFSLLPLCEPGEQLGRRTAQHRAQRGGPLATHKLIFYSGTPVPAAPRFRTRTSHTRQGRPNFLQIFWPPRKCRFVL